MPQPCLARGVLEVRIAKPEERKPRRVAIGVGQSPVIEGSSQESSQTGSQKS